MAGQPFAQDGGAWPICERCRKPIIPEGLGTALKPAWEPICLARKPLEGTVAQNVAKWGTGAINIDGCRVEGESTERKGLAEMGYHGGNKSGEYETGPAKGRWPPNLAHDGSEEVVSQFPAAPGAQGEVTGEEPSAAANETRCFGKMARTVASVPRADEGSAARFFYCAKTSRDDRDEGLEGFDRKPLLWSSGTKNAGSFQSEGTDKSARNSHPTVKPTELMRWLARLVTQPGGRVLDPFNGSGSTGKACMLEGFHYTGIDLDEEGHYLPIAKARILYALEHCERWEEIHAAPPPEPDIKGQITFL